MPKTKKISPDNNSLRSDFEEFWLLCRRKVEKKDAWREYQKARAIALKDEIHSGMAAYTQSVTYREDQHVKHPRTWLHRECWTDEVEEPAPPLRRETAREMQLRHMLQVTRDMQQRPH